MTGKQLRKFRHSLNFRLEDLAYVLDVSLDTISRWERDLVGIRHPSWLAITLEDILTNYNRLKKTIDGRAVILKEIRKRLKTMEKMQWVQNVPS